MLRYIIRRLLSMIPLLIFVTAVTFFLAQYGTSDLAGYLAATRGRQSTKAFDVEVYYKIRAELHLDDPVLVRYGRWLWNAAHGDLGRSYTMTGEPPVTYLIRTVVPKSLQLTLAGLVIAILVGVPLGVISAVFSDTIIDKVLISTTSVLSSIPSFVLAPVAIIVVVVRLNLLPSVGVGWHGLFAKETILPALCLAAAGWLTIARTTRVAILEVLSQEYVRAARARGLHERLVIVRHVLRNALLPVITVAGMMAGGLFGATIFIEQVFNIQGFGMMVSKAFGRGDMATIAGSLLVSTLIVMFFNLGVDLIYGLIDPRVRLAK